MLKEFAQTKEGQSESIGIWLSMQFNKLRNGRKDINLNNFIALNSSYCAYIVEGHLYQGYFTKNDIDNIFKVLDYHEGRIRALNG